MAGPKRDPTLKMTSVLLSDEDRALVESLSAVVAATVGVATLAAVIRYALRRTAEMEKAKQLASPPAARKARKPSKRGATAEERTQEALRRLQAKLAELEKKEAAA